MPCLRSCKSTDTLVGKCGAYAGVFPAAPGNGGAYTIAAVPVASAGIYLR